MYKPSQEILQKYADLLVNFALNSGEGAKKGEVITLDIPESSKDFLIPLQETILKSGCHPIIRFLPEDGVLRNFYENASDEQNIFLPKKYLKELVNVTDHFVRILSDKDLYELAGVDTKKIMDRNKAFKFFINERVKKEAAGKQTWVLALFGTPAMAKEAKMTEEEYWNQIIKACYLNEADPVAKWKEIFKKTGEIQSKLDKMNIEKVHIKGENVDLELGIGSDRKWVGGSGRNIPSFEIFTCPNWKEVNGWIKFDQPLYRHGDIIEGMELEFKNGVVVKSNASKNEKLFKDMLSVKGADKLGEFSLTDRRFSKIDKFMANTLFDENFGGEFGNTHIAIGKSFFGECYKGDSKKFKKSDWNKLGFNDSAIHTDLVSTTNRTVTATLQNGEKVVIYKDGEFII